MGFLSPLALILGAAIAVPLILHLFQRQQGPRVVFPALRYLRRAEKEHARRIRLRQLLLLVLRMLLLLLIAAAAARPFLRSGGSGHVPTAVVIVLDNSVSSGVVTQDRRILDVLEERAQETLLRAGPDDVFWLLRAGSPWEPAARGDATLIADRIRETEPSAAAASLHESIERAQALLEAGAGNRAREIHLLSDLQATNLGSARQAGSPVPLVVYELGGDPPPNRGVADVEIGGGLVPRAGERSTVAVQLRGTRQGDTSTVRLALGDRVVAAGSGVTGSSAILNLPGQSEGLLTGWVEVDADALRADDRRHFVVRITPLPQVALADATPFVDQALAVLEEAGRIRRSAAGAADVLVAPGGSGAAGARAGAGIVITPPENVLALPALNRALVSAGIPWRYAAPDQTGEVGISVEGTAEALQRQFSEVRIRRTYRLEPLRTGADSVLLRLADGNAFVVRGERPGGGSYLLLASPLSDTSTTFPTSAAMVPLMDLLTGAWASTSTAPADIQPGQAIAPPAAATAVVRPDGSRDSLLAGETYRAPAAAGVYRVFAGTELADAFVVNPPPAESDLTRVTGARLRAALPGWDVELADSPAEWERDVYRERLGREPWRMVVWLVLLLLIVEALAAASGRGTARAAPTEAAVQTTD